MAQKIYFDESGFTGNNLLHPQQKHFAYASVATDDDEAKWFVESLISKHRIQGGELKGSRLVRFHRGRKAIDETLDYFNTRLKISVSDKKFALACKFHEYIFEPSYASHNSLFYGTGFHRFIANILYLELAARGAGAEEIFVEFEELMRSKEEARLQAIFSSSTHPENSPILLQIREFAQFRAEDIRTELASLPNDGAGKWILDLTTTALFTLLADWGLEHEQITAVCDSSKPLQHDRDLFDSMIGRKDRVFSEISGERRPITFGLSGPIEFADSQISHGIQIADAIAAAAVYIFSGADDEHARRWRTIIPKIGHYGSVIPDADEVLLTDKRVQLNALLLLELHSRAKARQSLTNGIADFVRMTWNHVSTHTLAIE